MPPGLADSFSSDCAEQREVGARILERVDHRRPVDDRRVPGAQLLHEGLTIGGAVLDGLQVEALRALLDQSVG